jgi:hypothetical protein
MAEPYNSLPERPWRPALIALSGLMERAASAKEGNDEQSAPAWPRNRACEKAFNFVMNGPLISKWFKVRYET